MSILTFQKLSQSFGAFDVFEGASGKIEADSRIGLVGPNGIGKTTLLLLLAGLAETRAGSISIKDGVRLGYLRQEAMQAFKDQDQTVYDEMLAVFEGVQTLEAEMRAMEHRMSEGDSSPELLDAYGTVQEHFEHIGGYDYELRIEQVLDGLGFKREHWTLPLKHLSGGQKTRALLARLLLERPDLLILDEPTNHLDVDAVEWLEDTLRHWNGALLIVSHDRYFLDTVVNTVWEMSRVGIESYRGNYSAYLRQRQERHERLQKDWDALIERFYKELEFIQKNIATRARDIAIGKLRRVAREVEALRLNGMEGIYAIQNDGWMIFTQTYDKGRPVDSVKELRAAINALQNPILRQPRLNVDLKGVYRSGDVVLRAERLRIGYEGAPLFHVDNILLNRGDCAALIGSNGTGKTTLLRTITRQIPALAGYLQLGSGVKVGYFAQAHEGLNTDNTVIDELIHHKHIPLSQARNVLAQYLFRSEDVFKKVGALSGGERAKLAVAILAQQGANFLLLDEPTNHLDIAAQEVLQEVLEQFEGTVLLVTHDRYLVDRLATQVWTLEDGHMRIFNGTYQEFLTARTLERAAARKRPEPARINRRNLRPDDTAALENRITEMETFIRTLEYQLEEASAGHMIEDVNRLSAQYAISQTELDKLFEQWSAMTEA